MKNLFVLTIALVTLADNGHAQAPKPRPGTVGEPRPQTYVDRAAVEFATHEYASAWRANHQQRVMATMLPDAVLLPSGLAPIEGTAAITRFWFPASGPTTRVTAMDLTIDDVRIDGDLAVVSGRGTLTYVITTNGKPGEPRTQKSWFVNVLRRQPDARWLIARRAWSDVAR